MNAEIESRKNPAPKKITLKKVLVPLLISIATYMGLMGLSNFFSVKNIMIEGATDVRGIEDYFGKEIVTLSSQKVSTHLKKNNPKLSEVIVTKVYPDTLTIISTIKRPSVTLKLADGFITLAADGYIIQKSKENPEEKTPLINYYQPLFYNHYAIGDLFDNDDIRTVTRVSRSMADKGIKVSSIDIASENMLVLHTEDFDVFMTSEKDADQQFAEFEYTYKELKIDGMQFSSIDVRFEKPIIKLL
ncbi:hypothetical protein KBC70_00075 [Candidatus Woesebacteria bacterium]|nr:hypothetical protein [Candidatus Woesebacteria bacterium]